MAIGNYIKSNKASILYILDVLEQYSSFEHPLSVMEIKRILSEYPYNMSLDRETINSCLKELKAYYDDLIGNSTSEKDGTSGYTYKWYYNRSNSIYTKIDEMLNEMIYHPGISESYSKKLSDNVRSLFPPVQKIDEDELTSTNFYFAKQHIMSKYTYSNFKKLVNIIKENKLDKKEETFIRFEFNQYEIIKNKVKLTNNNKTYEVLPLAIVENDYQYWLIAYYEYQPNTEITNIKFNIDGTSVVTKEKATNLNKQEEIKERSRQLKHFRIDLISNIKTIKKPKEKNNIKKKLISQVSNKSSLDKYLNEHLFVAFNDEGKKEDLLSNLDEIMNFTIKASYDMGSITYLVDILGTDFTIIEANKNDCIIKLRCSKQSIMTLVKRYFDKIEILSPESIKKTISYILHKKANAILDKLYDYPYVQIDDRSYTLYRKLNRNKTYFCLIINNAHNGFEINNKKLETKQASTKKFENYLIKNNFSYELIRQEDDKYGYITDKFKTREELLDFIDNYKQDNIYIFYDIYKFKHNPNPNDKKKLGKFKIAKRCRYPKSNSSGGLANFLNKLEGNL